MSQIPLQQLGITYASQSLRNQIEATGWTIKHIKFESKRDKYEAVAVGPRGDECRQYGTTERLALSNLLLAVTRRTSSVWPKLSRWRTTFSDQMAEIAQAYAKAPLYDAKASASFMALAKDCERRAEALGAHLQIQVVNEPEPYAKPEQMIDDIKKRRKLVVSRAGADHPLWSVDQVVAYRICHDVLGYAAADSGWDWYGENEAFAAHVSLVPAEAQKALFTESIASTAYAAYYKAYGPLKICVFPQFMDKAQEAETGKAHPGQHPSQSFPPVAVPSVKPTVASSVAQDDLEAPEASQGLLDDLDLRTASAAHYAEARQLDPNSLRDPNYAWESGEAPMLTTNGMTIAQAYGDPLGTDTPNAEGETVGSNAAKITPKYNDIEWAYLNQHDPGQVEVMKKAVVNAFRVVLLSPRKDLMWNAIHYQHIQNVPGSEDDPMVYWNTLEKARQDWNEARGYDRYEHIPYMKYVPALINVVYQKDPAAGYDAARLRAQWMLHDWGNEIERKLEAMDEQKPEENRRTAFQIATKANYIMEERLKLYLAEHKPDLDKAMTRDVKKYWKEDEGQNELGDYYRHAAGVNALADPTDNQDWLGPQPDKRKYGAFMGNHLRTVAQISQHVDTILKAALEDVHEHNGAGWHFRAAVLQLGITGVGPKVCSFAWLLLQPMTSQLATIDTHILDVLGIHNEKQYNNRDYFGYERAFRARMDAAGYGHVPLGQLQWGMWDYKRTGPGTHQDHSSMRVLDPIPHDSVDWASKSQPINAQQAKAHKRLWFQQQYPGAEWWGMTQDVGKEQWDDWAKSMRQQVAKDHIPYQGLPFGYDPNDLPSTHYNYAPPTQDPGVYTASFGGRTPWFSDYQSGDQYFGNPGETNMAHLVRVTGLTVPQIWERYAEDGSVGKV